MCRVANGDDAVEVPLLEDMFLQRYQDRSDFPIHHRPKLESRCHVVVCPLSEYSLLIVQCVLGNVVAMGTLGQLEKEEPIDAAFGATDDEVGGVFVEHRVEGARLDASARVGDSKDAPIVARDA